MLEFDDDLARFEANETPPLPQSLEQGYVHNDGAEIFFSVYGSGPAVLLLHGGLGHSGNWSYQVPALLERGYQVILLDSRGHGRSSADERPYSYVTMATDVLAVLDHLKVQRATLIGWSDGATIGWSALSDGAGTCFGPVFLWLAFDAKRRQRAVRSNSASRPVFRAAS